MYYEIHFTFTKAVTNGKTDGEIWGRKCLHLCHELATDPLKRETYISTPYVYWTVHHLNSRIKRDQLDVTCFII